MASYIFYDQKSACELLVLFASCFQPTLLLYSLSIWYLSINKHFLEVKQTSDKFIFGIENVSQAIILMVLKQTSK